MRGTERRIAKRIMARNRARQNQPPRPPPPNEQGPLIRRLFLMWLVHKLLGGNQ